MVELFKLVNFAKYAIKTRKISQNKNGKCIDYLAAAPFGVDGGHWTPPTSRLSHASSESYTLGPCLSRHAEPCEGTVRCGTVGRRVLQLD